MIKMYIGLHVKCLLFLSDFNESRIFSTKFSINAQIKKFHENPSSWGGRVVPCGQTDKRTDMAKLEVAVSNFANAS